MSSKKLAKIISFILGPQLWFPLLVILFLTNTGLSSEQQVKLFPLFFFFQLILPLGYVYWLIKQKKISDWDIRDRKERYKVLPVFLLSISICLVFVFFLGTKLFLNLYIILLIDATIATVITYFWKISMHVGLNTVAALLVNFLFGWRLPALYLLIPLVSWARYYENHHSITQIFLGWLVSFVVVVGLLYFFGYLS